MKLKRITSTIGAGVILVAAIVTGSALLRNDNTVSAANANDFNPGRIIDDAVFYNSSALDASQIQNFLNSRVPNCDTNGTGRATEFGRGDITRAQYAASRGWHAPPYTCLKDFRQNTPQMEAASGLCNAISAKSNRSAASIISDVAKACGINPQVLVVLLEKEQSLITDIWPLDGQYRSATGFACPDTAPCNPAYNGFFYQVYHAARQFKVYQAYPNSYNYLAGRENRIYWNPDTARCGSSQVYIENQATAALYIYTPYRPNQAALNNLYGTGDSCSAYGNRNFWRLFTDWFGSTTTSSNTVFLQNGTYRLQAQSGNYLDVVGANTTEGTDVWTWEHNTSGAQLWEINRQADGFYTFKNPRSNKFLTATNASITPGTGTQIRSSISGCQQKWIVHVSGSAYRIMSACSWGSLNVTGGSSANGTSVTTQLSNDSLSQKWNLIIQDEAVIENDIYRLSYNSQSLDVSGTKTANGTNVNIWSDNYTGSQEWEVTRQADGFYMLKNPHSGKYLDVAGGGSFDGTDVRIWSGNTTCAQKWIVIETNGGHKLLSACSGKALDIAGGRNANGTDVRIWTSNDSGAQTWTLREYSADIANGTYRLETPGGKYLDVLGTGTKNGTNVWIWTQNNTGAQLWEIQKSGRYYTLKNPNSGKYLDVAGGESRDGTDVRIWSGNTTCAQKWMIVETNGGYSLISACSGKGLDVAGGKNTNGTDVRIWSYNTSGAQTWKLTRTDLLF